MNEKRVVVGLAALVAGTLVAETWWNNHYWQAVEPSAPTDHVSHEMQEPMVRVSSGIAGSNVAARSVSFNYSFESNRGLEVRFVQADCDYLLGSIKRSA